VVIDPKDGALHEVNGTLKLGPPKTKASARTVHLPPFLIDLFGELRDSDPLTRYVFTAPEGGWLAGRTFVVGSGCPRSRVIRDEAGPRSPLACIFMTYVIRTRRG
jgi:hypothetical protein